jgi:hypothetical protein
MHIPTSDDKEDEGVACSVLDCKELGLAWGEA